MGRVTATEQMQGKVIDPLLVHFTYDLAGRHYTGQYVIFSLKLQRRFAAGGATA